MYKLAVGSTFLKLSLLTPSRLRASCPFDHVYTPRSHQVRRSGGRSSSEVSRGSFYSPRADCTTKTHTSLTRNTVSCIRAPYSHSEHAQDSMQGDEAPAPSSSSADAAPISESESKGDDEPSQPSAAEPAPAEYV